MKRLNQSKVLLGLLSFFLVILVLTGTPGPKTGTGLSPVWAADEEMPEGIDFGTIQDFFVMLNPPNVDNLLPPLTLTVDQNAISGGGGAGYESHLEVTFVLNKIWHKGPGLFAKIDPPRLGTPGEFLKNIGGVLYMKPGQTLPFRVKRIKGSGMGWNDPERKTFKMDETGDDDDDPSALLIRGKSGATLLTYNFCVDDDGEGLVNFMPNLYEVILKFEFTEEELRGFEKSFSRTVKQEGGGAGTVKAKLKGKLYEELEADFTYSGKERGMFTLDAAKSKGVIKEYIWSFERDENHEYAAGISFDSRVKLEGESVDVMLLEPVKVKLEVKLGNGMTHTKEKLVDVQPRKFETEFERLTGRKRIGQLGPKNVLGFSSMVLGRSVCSICYKNDPSYDQQIHYLHPKGRTGKGRVKTWEGEDGYTIAKVEDGPFYDTYYVKKYRVRLFRSAILNEHLFDSDPGGTHCHPLSVEKQSFYQYNKDNPDLEPFLYSIEQHENIHIDLEQEIWEKYSGSNDDNIANKIEKTFSGGHDDLCEKVNILLLNFDQEIEENDTEKKVYERMKELWAGKKTVLKIGLLTFEFVETDSRAKGVYKDHYVDIFDFLQ